jgi:hypothetical protein
LERKGSYKHEVMQDSGGDVVELSYVVLSSAVESCDQVVETSSQARETLDAIARTISP